MYLTLGEMRNRLAIILILLFFAPFGARGESVGLVLSGGGAKGLSHVGVIKALEENDIPIDYICGTSIGAIVGGLYAIGYSPDEMMALFKSAEFESWYKGLPEPDFATYFYRDEFQPAMVEFSFGSKLVNRKDDFGKEKRVRIDMPTSLVSPYPMDIAVLQIFTEASEAAGGNYDSLMVPFFCVASDIVNKKAVVMRSGNLGSSVRASMTYPLYFKPITIDSTLMFDGGIYDNFPWQTMKRTYSPDFLIGVKCVTGDMTLDEDDVSTQVTNMLMSYTDYDIPEEEGVVIARKYPFGLMDFDKADKIVQMGYENALKYIPQIKERVKGRRTEREVNLRRAAFRERLKPIRFEEEIILGDNLSESKKEFIKKNIVKRGEGPFGLEKLKRGYYNVAATGLVKTFYPYYNSRPGDSLLTLGLRVTESMPWNVAIGGNISSSSLNQGYLSLSYSKLSRNPWQLAANVNMGKYYKGGKLFFRHNIGVDPLSCYSAEFTAHQFDYYNGNQNLFASDRMPDNVQRLEYYGRLNFLTPVLAHKNIFARFSFVLGGEYYKYYQGNDYTSRDIPDKTFLTLVSPMIGIERNTLDYPLYATSGNRGSLTLRFDYALESFKAGTTSDYMASYDFRRHRRYLFKFYYEAYTRISKWFTLGYLADMVVSQENSLGDYFSTVLYMPAFRPVPHNSTVLMEDYRAYSYIGAGISPIVKFTDSFYLHANFSYFQPYKRLVRLDRGDFAYSSAFPRGSIIANAALVWQSPIGPVSFSTTYYDSGEYKWYPQLNIGYLLFNKKAQEF